jgi:hypothetical protein
VILGRSILSSILATTAVSLDVSYVLGRSLGTVLDAKPFAQITTRSGSATAAVILLEWKNKIPISKHQMARPNYEAGFNSGARLNGVKFLSLALALHFRTKTHST